MNDVIGAVTAAIAPLMEGADGGPGAKELRGGCANESKRPLIAERASCE